MIEKTSPEDPMYATCLDVEKNHLESLDLLRYRMNVGLAMFHSFVLTYFMKNPTNFSTFSSSVLNIYRDSDMYGELKLFEDSIFKTDDLKEKINCISAIMFLCFYKTN